MVLRDCCSRLRFYLRQFRYHYCCWNFIKRYIKLAIVITTILIILHMYADPLEIEVSVSYHEKSKIEKAFPCENPPPEAVNAYGRAKTPLCQREIVRYGCLVAEEKLFPLELETECPLNNFTAKGELVGCYRSNSSVKVLQHDIVLLPATNSPSNCIEFCINGGHALAGLQAGETCLCADMVQPSAEQLALFHCESHICPGDHSSTCGGTKATKVYRTGLHAKEYMPAQKYVEPPTNGSFVTPPVKILFFFVVTGRSSRQLRRLLNLIYSRHHFYYIHVDVRCDYLYDQLLELETQVDNIRLKRDRLTVVWAGPSQFEVLRESLRDLFRGIYGPWRWDFVINLTESDFPLWNLEDQEWFLAEHKGKNFLHPRPGTNNYQHFQGFDLTFLECEGRMWQVGVRKVPKNLSFYGMSEHYVITGDFARYVADVNPDPLLKAINLLFNHTILAPETYLATALINSRFCGTAVWMNMRRVNWQADAVKGMCLRTNIVDWCIVSPMDWRVDDLPKALSPMVNRLSAHYFARKFEAIVDQKVIRVVEERLIKAFYYRIGHRHFYVSTPALTDYWENIYTDKFDRKLVPTGTVELMTDIAGLSLKTLLSQQQHNIQASIVAQSYYKRVTPMNMTILRKNDNITDMLIGFTAVCNAQLDASRESNEEISLETRVRLIPQLKIEQNANLSEVTERLTYLEIGNNFDLKEKFFRDYLRLLTRNRSLTVAHYWDKGEPNRVKLALYQGMNSIVQIETDLTEEAKKFDWTVTDLPPIPIDLLMNDQLSSTMQLQVKFANQLVASADILILENQRISLKEASAADFVDHLDRLSRFYEVIDTCVIKTNSDVNCGFDHLTECHETRWSSFSPDPKSHFKPLRSGQTRY